MRSCPIAHLRPQTLHLPTLGNNDIHIRHVPPLVTRPCHLDLAHHVHAVSDAAEDDMLVVEERGGHGGDEELASVRVWAGVL